MTLTEIIFIGIGLSMDAVAVAMTNSMAYKSLKTRDYIAMILLFSVFQAIMPLIGYFAGEIFAEIISKYAGIVILVILGIIGGKMIKEGFTHMKEQKGCEKASVCIPSQKKLTLNILIFQAIATSIDAFAVGIGFSAMRVDIIESVLIIAIVTVDLVTLAIVIGRKFGDILGCRAEIVGGIILAIIGIKAIL